MSHFPKDNSELSANRQTLLDLLLQKEELGEAAVQEIPRRQPNAPLQLSFAQQRLWFLNQWEPGSSTYNIPRAFRLTGPLNIGALEQSLNEILRRHEALRTVFATVDGQPVQVIAPAEPLALPVVNLQDLPETEREAETQRLVKNEGRKPFDLAKGPLFQATLLRLGEKEHVLLLTMHHITSDGWSMGILFRELSVLYEAFSARRPSPLPELPIQYGDFAQWQRQWLQGEELETHLAYWKEQLADLPTLELPTNHPRPAVQTYRGANQPVMIHKSLSEALKELSRREGATLFMTLLAAFQTLLHRYTGQEDIVVGTPIAGRNRIETEGLIGFFANTLVQRTKFSGNPSFRELLGRVREVALGAYTHQELPFEMLVEVLQPERDLSRNPLFQVMFVLQNTPSHSLELSGLTLSPLKVGSETAKFDLNLLVTETEQGLIGPLQYNTDLFEADTIIRMLGHFHVLLEGIVANPEQRLSDLPMLTEKERQQLLVEWNDTATEYPKEKCIHQLFEAQVERTPDAIAVVFENEQLTYRELNTRANQLAHCLRERGIKPEVLVGICMERSLEMMVGLLGILKAGGAYVPLDPSYPQERLAFMLEDTQVPVLLTQQHLATKLPDFNGNVICLDADWSTIKQESENNPVNGVTADNLTYVNYTSGSTGTPKGTSIIHRGVVSLVKSANYVDLGPDQVFLQFAPISFDASTFELWASLLNGSKLVVFPPHTPSLEELGEVIKKQGVSILWLTAALFHQMVDGHLESLSGVQQLLAGGDVLSVSHVQRMIQVLGDRRLINGYGPSENTTFTCCHVMTGSSRIEQSVLIGRPISNTQVYILDRYMQPLPIGVYGELHIGGVGLAREYLNQPELTAEKFISHPFSDNPGARLYKTGDLARYLPDGNIEFLGRIDDQVKIHGFRIEPGEIETVLGQHPTVREAVVTVRENTPGNRQLVAYLIHNQQPTPSNSDLRRFLKAKLPEYMVPSVFLHLDALPLTPNGKVDRQALPVPDGTRPELESVFVAPRTPTEEVLAEIWAEVLGLKQVGVYDNFFELGGHSLKATQVISRIRVAFRMELPLRSLFEKPTIEELAGVIEETLVGKIEKLTEDEAQELLKREAIEL